MKKEFGGNILKLLFFIACGYGIVRISIWSYFQTQLFFIPFDTDGTNIISNGLALIFQYGQNVALFLATIEAGRRIAYQNKIVNSYGNKAHINILEEEIRKSKNTSNVYYVLFTSFALIDAGTNVGQFYLTTFLDAKNTMSGIPLNIFMGVGTLVSIAVVFVEELFMDTANATLHAVNDVLESVGIRRIPSLDLFIDPDKMIATRLEERGGAKQSNYSNNRNESQRNSSDQKNNTGLFDSRNNSSPIVPREITYTKKDLTVDFPTLPKRK